MIRNKVIVVVLVWFFWAAGQDLDAIVRYPVKTDYYILSSIGTPALYFAVIFLVFLLNIATIWYLFRPKPKGLWVAMTALGAGGTQTIVSLALVSQDIDGYRRIYAAGREARGLVVREEALDMIFSQGSLVIGGLVVMAFYVAIGVLIVWRKSYFSSPQGRSGAI